MRFKRILREPLDVSGGFVRLNSAATALPSLSRLACSPVVLARPHAGHAQMLAMDTHVHHLTYNISRWYYSLSTVFTSITLSIYNRKNSKKIKKIMTRAEQRVIYQSVSGTASMQLKQGKVYFSSPNSRESLEIIPIFSKLAKLSLSSNQTG